MTIEILNYEKANKGKVVGYLDIKATLKEPTIIAKRIAHLESNGKSWLNLPNFILELPDGSKSFVPWWQLYPQTTNAQFMEAIKQKLDLHLAAKENDSLPF